MSAIEQSFPWGVAAIAESEDWAMALVAAGVGVAPSFRRALRVLIQTWWRAKLRLR